jgi:hypothetical protein
VCAVQGRAHLALVEARQALDAGAPGADAAHRAIDESKDTLAQFLDDQVRAVRWELVGADD